MWFEFPFLKFQEGNFKFQSGLISQMLTFELWRQNFPDKI